MNRFERWLLWASTLLVGGTGIGFFWTRYLVTPTDPFSVLNHPLEPVFLKAHVVTAPLLVFALGAIAVRHIWKHIRVGVRRARRTGLVTACVVVPMVLTGYLIQVLTGESLLRAMVWSHIGFSVVYLVGAGLHGLAVRWSARRWGRTSDAAPPPPTSTGDSGSPDAAAARSSYAPRRSRRPQGVEG